VLVAARSRLEWSHRVKAPNGKRPGQWNCPQNLSRDVLLLAMNWQPLHRRTRS
jgi:hypothetical protein